MIISLSLKKSQSFSFYSFRTLRLPRAEPVASLLNDKKQRTQSSSLPRKTPDTEMRLNYIIQPLAILPAEPAQTKRLPTQTTESKVKGLFALRH